MGNFINKCGSDLIDKKTRDEIAEVNYHLGQKKFVIMSVLGSGSYGSVYKVRHATSFEEYALKIVPKDRATVGEIELWATLEHTNVHRLISSEFVEHANVYLFWSNVCPRNLKIEVSRFRITDDEMPFTQASNWVQDILSGLSYLHGRSLSHLDLKCDNVLISTDQTALLADFGFLTSCEIPVSRYGAPLHYRCPEAKRGRKEVDGKAFDIWTLGTLTFEVFTGNHLSREVCMRRLFGSSIECWRMQVYPILYECLQCEKFAELVKKMFPSSLKDIDENLDMLSNFIRSCLTLIPEMRPSIDLLQKHQLFGGSFDKVHLKPHQDIWNNMVSPENISALMGEPAESSERDSPQEKSETQSQPSEVIMEIQNPDPVLEEYEFTESQLREMIEREISTPDVDMKIPGLISNGPNTDAVLYGIYVVEGPLSAPDDASSLNMESISEENPSLSIVYENVPDTLGHQTRNRPLRKFWKRTKKAFGRVLSTCVPTCMKKKSTTGDN